MAAAACTEDDFIALWETHRSQQKVADVLGIGVRKVHERRRRIEARTGLSLDCQAGITSAPVSQLTASDDNLRKSSVFVVTSAQNDTLIVKPFWKSLMRYCKVSDAQMLVIPTKYRNMDAFHQDEGSAWPPEVLPYLLDRDFTLSDTLMVMGDGKINATASNPLGSLDALSGPSSAIYGHAQVQMRMVATPANELPKMLHTTGSVSEKNYSRSKAGKLAGFHHTHCALVIEVSGSKFWARELHFDGIGFYDLDKYYKPGGITKGHRAEALILGDEHVKFSDAMVQKATFGADGITETLRPKVLVRHDIHDHYSQSHHHESDTILKVQKTVSGDWSVGAELELSSQHITDTTPDNCESWIIDSNHHDHLYKWLNRFDANRDPHNAIFAWKLQGWVADAIARGLDADPFRLYLRYSLPDKVKKRTRFVGPSDAATIAGVDVSQHGDRGPNGARPSPIGFARSSRKMFVGHSHTPGIFQGCYTVGTSTKNMEYAKGLSSWMTTHGIIYANGKRALLHVVEGRWRRAALSIILS